MGKITSEYPTTFRMVQAWEKERTEKGSKCAKKIREEIERLSGYRLTLKPMGISVECGYVPDLHVISEHLDYHVFYEGKHVATIDPTCSNYTFEGSQIMPVRYYKGLLIKQSKVPVFIVFSMEKETKSLEDRCVWVHGEDVIKSPDEWRFLGGKDQHNYMTDKADWHRGLQKLVDVLTF